MRVRCVIVLGSRAAGLLQPALAVLLHVLVEVRDDDLVLVRERLVRVEAEALALVSDLVRDHAVVAALLLVVGVGDAQRGVLLAVDAVLVALVGAPAAAEVALLHVVGALGALVGGAVVLLDRAGHLLALALVHDDGLKAGAVGAGVAHLARRVAVRHLSAPEVHRVGLGAAVAPGLADGAAVLPGGTAAEAFDGVVDDARGAVLFDLDVLDRLQQLPAVWAGGLVLLVAALGGHAGAEHGAVVVLVELHLPPQDVFSMKFVNRYLNRKNRREQPLKRDNRSHPNSPCFSHAFS